MNYKVRVKNEVESKEVQELLESLGFNCGITVLSQYIYAKSKDMEAYTNVIDPNNYKELTTPQLKDMVVLNRNSVDDATHEDYTGLEHLLLSNTRHVWGGDRWLISSADFSKLKPIEKKEMKMKEYLDPDNGYALITADDEIKGGSNWIEVPYGSEAYIELKSGKKGFYKWHTNGFCIFDGYRHNFLDEFCHSIKSILWVGELSNDHLKNYLADVFWQSSEMKKVQGGKSQWDIQVGGDHYKSMKIQPAKFALENKLDYCQANAIKYICRHESKNGKQDLEKAKHYIDLLIEHYYGGGKDV